MRRAELDECLMLGRKFRVVADPRDRGRGADPPTAVGDTLDPGQLGDVLQIDDAGGRPPTFAQLRDEIRAAGEDARVAARQFRHRLDDRRRPEISKLLHVEFLCRSHCKG